MQFIGVLSSKKQGMRRQQLGKEGALTRQLIRGLASVQQGSLLVKCQKNSCRLHKQSLSRSLAAATA